MVEPLSVLYETATAYREWAPPPAWEHAVTCLWEHRVGPVVDLVHRVLPDRCGDVIVDQAGNGSVVGVHDQPLLAALAPGTVLRGLRFRPEAVGRALGAEAASLRNETLDLGAVVGPARARALTAALLDGALDEVHQWLTELRMDRRTTAAVHALATPSDVVAVADRVGLSTRQLRRLVLADVGVGPKTLQRVSRFWRFMAMAERPGSTDGLALLAGIAGYTDQAHLTKEVRELSGLPPAALLSERSA